MAGEIVETGVAHVLGDAGLDVAQIDEAGGQALGRSSRSRQRQQDDEPVLQSVHHYSERRGINLSSFRGTHEVRETGIQKLGSILYLDSGFGAFAAPRADGVTMEQRIIPPPRCKLLPRCRNQ